MFLSWKGPMVWIYWSHVEKKFREPIIFSGFLETEEILMLNNKPICSALVLAYQCYINLMTSGHLTDHTSSLEKNFPEVLYQIILSLDSATESWNLGVSIVTPDPGSLKFDRISHSGLSSFPSSHDQAVHKVCGKWVNTNLVSGT